MSKNISNYNNLFIRFVLVHCFNLLLFHLFDIIIAAVYYYLFSFLFLIQIVAFFGAKVLRVFWGCSLIAGLQKDTIYRLAHF